MFKTFVCEVIVKLRKQTKFRYFGKRNYQMRISIDM